MRSAGSATKCFVQNASNAAASPSAALQRAATRSTPDWIAARCASPCFATNAATARVDASPSAIFAVFEVGVDWDDSAVAGVMERRVMDAGCERKPPTPRGGN